MSIELARERVARGAAWLESVKGKAWVNSIDLYTLNLRSARYCVLGQMFNNEATADMDGFDVGMDLGNPEYPEPVDHYDERYHWAQEHGFDTRVVRSGGVDYDMLQKVWEQVIREAQDGDDEAPAPAAPYAVPVEHRVDGRVL